LKKWIKNIGLLIEGWSKKQYFASPILPFRIIEEAEANCINLQITQTDAQSKIYKRVQPTEGSSRIPLKFKNLVSNFCQRTDRNGIYFCKFMALKRN
jgi:hypothetical protein